MVAELLGIKLFLNEFVAYQELSQYKQRRLAGAEEWVGAKKQWISVSVRSPLRVRGMTQLLSLLPWPSIQSPISYCPGLKTASGHTAITLRPLRRLRHGEGALLAISEI